MANTLREAHRVLKPGGLFIVFDCFRGSDLDALAEDLRVAARLVEKTTAVDSFWPVARWLTLGREIGFLVEDEVTDLTAAVWPDLLRLRAIARSFFEAPLLKRELSRFYSPLVLENAVERTPDADHRCSWCARLLSRSSRAATVAGVGESLPRLPKATVTATPSSSEWPSCQAGTSGLTACSIPCCTGSSAEVMSQRSGRRPTTAAEQLTGSRKKAGRSSPRSGSSGGPSTVPCGRSGCRRARCKHLADRPLEEQIAQWRTYLRRRQAVHGPDVEELEGHLRDQLVALTQVAAIPEWLSAARVSASRSNRESRSGSTANSSGRTLSATSRRSLVSVARYTWPMPPHAEEACDLEVSYTRAHSKGQVAGFYASAPPSGSALGRAQAGCPSPSLGAGQRKAQCHHQAVTVGARRRRDRAAVAGGHQADEPEADAPAGVDGVGGDERLEDLLEAIARDPGPPSRTRIEASSSVALELDLDRPAAGEARGVVDQLFDRGGELRRIRFDLDRRPRRRHRDLDRRRGMPPRRRDTLRHHLFEVARARARRDRAAAARARCGRGRRPTVAPAAIDLRGCATPDRGWRDRRRRDATGRRRCGTEGSRWRSRAAACAGTPAGAVVRRRALLGRASPSPTRSDMDSGSSRSLLPEAISFRSPAVLERAPPAAPRGPGLAPRRG